MLDEKDLKINTLEVMMEQNTKDHNEIKETVVAFGEKLDKSLARMEDKFAGKWVEKAILGFIIIVLTGLCSYLGTLIYKAVIHLQ